MDGKRLDWEQLLQHRPFVRALARRLVRDEARADDLVQQTWLTAIEQPPRHAGKLRAWLAAVVRNLARTQNRAEWRRTRHEKKGTPGRTPPTPDEVLEKATWHGRLVDAVLELEEPYRTTVLLRYFEELDSNAIGAMQGVPPATVRTRLRRGLAQLREKLDRTTDGGRAGWVPALVLLARPPAPMPAPAPAPSAPGAAWLVPAAVVATLLVAVTSFVAVGLRDSADSSSPARRDERPAALPGPDLSPPAEPVTVPRATVGHRLDVLVLADGRPAAGAAVVVESAAPHAWRAVPTDDWRDAARGATQGDGHAWFAELPDGYVRIRAWQPGRARGTGYAFLPQAIPYAIVVELPAEDAAPLEVVDAETGAPWPGAWVGVDRPPAPDSYRADAAGRVTIRGLGAGETTPVEVDAPGAVARVVSARAERVELERADRTVRWPLAGTPVPDGTPVELRRDGVRRPARIEGGFLVADGLPRGTWPEHEAWAEGPLVARVEAPRGTDVGAPARFAAPALLRVELRDPAPVLGLPLRLEDPATGEPLGSERTDGVFVRADDRPVRLAYRERAGSRWRPLRSVTSGDVVVRLPEPVRIRLVGDLPARLAVYVDRERFESSRARDGAIDLELRAQPGRARARVDLLAHGRVAAHREFDLEAPGDVLWEVELEPASSLVARVRGTIGELVLADPSTGEPRWRGPWWFRLAAGPDGIVRESMIPPGRHVIRDLVRGVTSAPFDAPGDVSLRVDLDAAEPWVEGRVLAPVTFPLARTALEAVPGGPVEMLRDGSFRFAWTGPCELVARGPDGGEARVRVDRPDAPVRVPLAPRATLRLDPARPAGRGRIVARGSGATFVVDAREDLAFEGFPPGVFDLWIDLPGCVPIERAGVRLAEGDNVLAVEGDPGATLRVTTPGDLPLRVAAHARTEPRYLREGEDLVAGLGPGRFHVTVWDRFTGRRLFSGEVESPGHGEIALAVDPR